MEDEVVLESAPVCGGFGEIEAEQEFIVETY